MVAFNQIPANARVPLFWAEIEPAQAPYSSNSVLLLCGHRLATGSVGDNDVRQINDDVRGLYGEGSMLAQMYDYARSQSGFQEIWALTVAEPAGVAATGTFTVGAPSGVAGTAYVYVEGSRIAVAVGSADTANTIATNIAAEINDTENLSVTAAAATNVVTCTARHAGILGNDIDIAINLVGDEGAYTTNLITVAQMGTVVAGTGTVNFATALANLSDQVFDVIAAPFSDTTSLNDVQDFLDGITGRWSPTQQLYGHYITAKNDTQANLGTFGNGRNDPHASIMGYTNSPSTPWAWASAIGGAVANRVNGIGVNLSRPFQEIELRGIVAPAAVVDRFSIAERQALYFDGIAGYRVHKDGTVYIDRLTTTYQTNSWGISDPSWLDANTLFQAYNATNYIKAKITGIHGSDALADENPFNLDGLTTPDDVRRTILHGLRELVALGVLENYELMEQALIVQRNGVDANRVDVLLPFDMVNQLRIVAVKAVTHLQLGSYNPLNGL